MYRSPTYASALRCHLKVLRHLKLLTLLIFFFTTSFFATTTHASVVNSLSPNAASLRTGLVGHWTFDGKDMVSNVKDVSGQGNHAYLTGITSTSSAIAPGKTGQAFQFNGNGKFLTIQTGGSLPQYTSSGRRTFAFWIKASSVADQTVYAETGATARYDIVSTNGTPFKRLRLVIYDGSQFLYSTFVSASNVFDSKWHHVAIIDSAGVITTFIDGVYDMSASYNAGAMSLNASFIGKNIEGSNLLGALDDFRIYNYALSTSTIRQLYSLGLNTLNKTAPNRPPLREGITGWWTFDGPDMNWTTGKATDRGTGNSGSTGTLVGFSTTTSVIAGKMGQALGLRGNQFMTVANSLSSFETAANGTISLWMYPQNGNSTGCTTGTMSALITDFDGASAGANSFIGYDGTNACVGGNDGVIRQLSTAVPKEKWTHIVMVHGSGGLQLWKDGVFVSARSLSNLSDLTLPFFYGVSIGGNYYKGLMDDVRIYSTALSTTSIQAIYYAGAGTKQGLSLNTPRSPLQNGLIGWWTFDGPDVNWATGIVTDKSGNGNNGSVVNMSTTTGVAAGVIGQALAFNGRTSYVDTANIANNLADFTVSAWIQSPGFVTGLCNPIVTKLNTSALGSATGWWMCQVGDPGILCSVNTVFVAIQTDGSNWRGKCSSVLKANKWQHVVMVVSGANTVTLYLDGVSQATANNGGTMGSYSNSNNVRFGKDYVSEFWKGNLDDVRIYNRALTAAEVTQLYNMGR